ncbi:transglutaminase-like domain-containing protein [Desulfococcaceae bacterium HSG9]|nr:transglutaminase-like domain-containing protein [Desulfococcaceae bacterium HSG9]
MENNLTITNRPFLIGTGVLFWGWLADFFIPAIFIAVILEGARFIKFRWPLDFADFRRVAIISDIFIFLVIIIVSTNKTVALRGVLFIQWLPLITAPIIIAQFYSKKERIHLWALFLTFGKTKNKKPKLEPLVDLSYPFLILCVLSASAANIRDLRFYTGVLILAAYALQGMRSRRYAVSLWVGLLIMAAAAGYWGSVGLHQFQRVLENTVLNWYLNKNDADADPYRSRTAIGDIGELKLSGQILFRVRTSSEATIPLLLRETSYNVYHVSMWFARKATFERLSPDSDGKTWTLHKNKTDTSLRMMISDKLRRGKGLLKLPDGAWMISNLPVMTMEANPYGAVRIEDGPDMVNYIVRYHPEIARDRPPDQSDLKVPENEVPAIYQIGKALKLEKTSPSETLKILKHFFYNNFKYSLHLETSQNQDSPLSQFLLRTRAGHCEYFATSATLLLRSAGIPARYATGYLVDEFSSLEKCFVVRKRHAHAWTLAYLNGRWQNFDATPPDWPGIEAENASQWQSLSDFFAYAWFKFSEWRTKEEGNRKRTVWLWLLAPLILYLGRRLFMKKRVLRTSTRQPVKMVKDSLPGTDSHFYRIEERLHAQGFTRRSGETLTAWVKRIQVVSDHNFNIRPLLSILKLHYRLRFDPQGISKIDKALLHSEVDSWLRNGD